MLLKQMICEWLHQYMKIFLMDTDKTPVVATEIKKKQSFLLNLKSIIRSYSRIEHIACNRKCSIRYQTRTNRMTVSWTMTYVANCWRTLPMPLTKKCCSRDGKSHLETNGFYCSMEFLLILSKCKSVGCIEMDTTITWDIIVLNRMNINEKIFFGVQYLSFVLLNNPLWLKLEYYQWIIMLKDDSIVELVYEVWCRLMSNMYSNYHILIF